jgi:hypothetical protein
MKKIDDRDPEVVDVDLDIINLFKKLPLDHESAHFYFNVNGSSVSTMGGGSSKALTQGFFEILDRHDGDIEDTPAQFLLDAALTFLCGQNNKDVLELFYKELKKQRKNNKK